jgi:hypothetical protein
MTSKRRIKKEIDYLVSDMIYDCFTFTGLYPQSDNDEVMKLVQKTLTLRNELRNKANHPEQKEDSVTVKAHYDNLADTLVKSLDESYEKLGEMVGKAS